MNEVTTEQSNLALNAEQNLADDFESKMVMVQSPTSTLGIEETTGIVTDVVVPLPKTEAQSGTVEDLLAAENITTSVHVDHSENCREETVPTCQEPTSSKTTGDNNKDSDSLTPTTTAEEETMPEDEGNVSKEPMTAPAVVTVGEPVETESPNEPLDIQSERRKLQEEEIKESEKIGNMEPFKMLKKGAVAAVGGTMVGVGLVMIPLPTPFGAVVASSGLAVLGTEFESAREMNETLIKKTKEGMETARDHVIRSIESMESNSDDSEDDSDSESDNESPEWLQMEPVQRKRQLKMMKLKYKRENQSKWDETSEYISKSTGSFLSRTVLPFLKRSQAVGVKPEERAKPPEPAAEKVEEAPTPQDVIEDSVLVVRPKEGEEDALSGVPVSDRQSVEEIMVVEPSVADSEIPKTPQIASM